jgi:predicted carbohydrate-binding protein with CBM5 and CBM33 domain
MKQITMAVVLLAVAALETMGAINYNSSKSNSGNFTLQCIGDDGKGCSAEHVASLNKAMLAAQRKNPALAKIKKLGLASSDGTLTCELTDGKPCGAEQAAALDAIDKPTGMTSGKRQH